MASESHMSGAGAPEAKPELVQIRPVAGRELAPRQWQSLREAEQSEREFQRHDEFPEHAQDWPDGVSRRNFLKLMGASAALAGMSACVKQPPEPIVPYVRQPEELVLGKPLYYATAMPMGGFAHPVLAVSHEGRPTKIEGNPEHPAALGGTDIFMQASILGLYDPDRSQDVLYAGEIRPYASFLGAMRGPLTAQRQIQGAGLRFLTTTDCSPTQATQFKQILQKYPAAKWYQYEAVNRDGVHAGARMAFGQPVATQYLIENADVIVSLDANILYGGFPGFLRYARHYGARRKPEGERRLNRMYAVESSPTTTGFKADHHWRMRASEIEGFTRALASALGVSAGGSVPGGDYGRKWLAALVKDLEQNRGTSLIIAGEQQPPIVHALAHAMNQALGNAGKTVIYTDPVETNPGGQMQGLRELVDDMRAAKVDVMVMMGGNPVYDAPADLAFAEALDKVPLRVHFGLYQDETSGHCHWHVNEAHYLEAWSDARAHDGTVSIIQPLIAPLYAGHSKHELLALFNDQPDLSGYDIVRGYWQSQHPGPEFETFWRKALHDGFIAGTALPPRQVTVKSTGFAANAPGAPPQEIEIIFRPDPSIYDGRFGNNAWLQELPKPLTKMTWDNAVLVGPALAQHLELKDMDVVELQYEGRKVTGAVWVQAGHPDNAVTVFLGYGHTHFGRAANGAGFNASRIRTTGRPWFITGAQVRKTGDTYKLACTQGMQSMDPYYWRLGGEEERSRQSVRVGTLEEYEKNPSFAHEHQEEPTRDFTLYPNYEYTGYAWGMAIDLGACIGCNACVVACQSENNIPVVGKFEVTRQRSMHWLRVDNYYQGDPAHPDGYFQPVPCMQCENAPCELVCPVGATVHSTEGLNDMVYNRCVGTRYCSNNCPYKVRRFNFLLFQDWDTPQFKMLRNPDVSVRSRGVMEKCTYCVQRINRGRIHAEEEDRRVRDGEVLTACQQACPADAIIFGDINDKNSRVGKLKSLPRNYALLAELNTRPRTTYLATIRNPNPDMPDPNAERS